MKIKAKVIKGVQIGAKFGIATANLELASLPKIEEGVYLATVDLADEVYDALFHFGPRKTFGGDFSAEVHILDFDQEIYGKTLSLVLGKKLRAVKAFKNADQLFTQIETDILGARKYFLRQKIARKWAALSLHDQAILAGKALLHVGARVEFLETKRVFLYAPQRIKEISFVASLMQAFPEKKYLFPLIKNSKLKFYEVSDYKDLVVGEFSILTPQAVGRSELPTGKDILFVPSVAVDKLGNRLGRGGGYYDKFLATLDSKVKTIAVLPTFAIVEKIPTQVHDQPVDLVIGCEV